MKKWLAFLLAAILLFTICACTPNQKTEERVNRYLHDKYGDLTFELIDYSRDKEASGRYFVNVLCVNADIKFQMIVSSLMITDSLMVESANAAMESELLVMLSGEEKPDVPYIRQIQWMDLYEDDSTGFKFRTPSEELSYDVKDLKELYRVSFAETKTASDVAEHILDFIVILSSKGVSFDRVSFSYTLDGKNFVFNTDTDSIKHMTGAALTEQVKSISEGAGSRKDIIFYPNSNEYVIDCFMDKAQ